MAKSDFESFQNHFWLAGGSLGSAASAATASVINPCNFLRNWQFLKYLLDFWSEKKNIADYQFFNNIQSKSIKWKKLVEKCYISYLNWAGLKIKLAISNKNWHFSDDFQKNKINNTLEFSCEFFSSKHGVFFSRKEKLWIFAKEDTAHSNFQTKKYITRIHIISFAWL